VSPLFCSFLCRTLKLEIVVLGVYLTTSDAQSADVELQIVSCWWNRFFYELIVYLSVHTSQYQAMYRVLNAFSLMNAVLSKEFRPSNVILLADRTSMQLLFHA